MRFLRLVILMGLLCPAAAGCAAKFEYTQLVMGVQARVVISAFDEPKARRAAQAAFARMEEIDAVASDYRPDSELMRLCAAPAGTPVAVSRDLFELLARAREVSEASDGAFDVTFGPLIALWRESRRSGALPGAAAVEDARRRVGWRKVHLNSRRREVTLAESGMRLDLGGIAKGYAAHRAIETLARHQARRALVALSGDVAVGAAPRFAKGWVVEVDHGESRARHAALLENRCVSTSGGSEQFVEIGGIRYSHILDPRTGLGLTQPTAATVIAKDGATADALATMLCVTGRSGLRAVERFRDAAACTSSTADGRVQADETPGYRKHVVPAATH